MKVTTRLLLLMMTAFCFFLALFMRPLLDSIALGNILLLPRTLFGDSTKSVAYLLMLTLVPALYLAIFGLIRYEDRPVALLPALACIVLLAPQTLYTAQNREVVLLVIASMLTITAFEILIRKLWRHTLAFAAVLDLTLVYWTLLVMNTRI